MGHDVHLEVISWLDHCSMVGKSWNTMEDVLSLEPITIQSVGWLLKETSDYVILASHFDEQEVNVGGDILILKATIKSRNTLVDPRT